MMQPNEDQEVVDEKIATVAPTGRKCAHCLFDCGYSESKVFSTSRDANDSCGECSLCSVDDNSICSLFRSMDDDSVCSSISSSSAKSDSICISSNQLYAETESAEEEYDSEITVSSEENAAENSDYRQGNDFSTSGKNISTDTEYIDIDENPTRDSNIINEAIINLNMEGCFHCRGLIEFVKYVMCLCFVCLGIMILYSVPFFNGI